MIIYQIFVINLKTGKNMGNKKLKINGFFKEAADYLCWSRIQEIEKLASPYILDDWQLKYIDKYARTPKASYTEKERNKVNEIYEKFR